MAILKEKETKDSINNVDISSTGEVKYYYSDKEPIYASFDMLEIVHRLTDKTPNKLRDDIKVIYKEVIGKDYEWRRKES